MRVQNSTALLQRIFGLLLVSVLAGVASVAGWARLSHAQGAGLDSGLELVDPKVLRVCADPNNLPFSNDKGEGFENKFVELLAQKLNRTLAYAWYPQATGFVRNTLGAHRCDVIPGFPQGDELVQSTNPYYRTAYALVVRPGDGLDDVNSLADPRLKTKRIGIVAGTPPATYLAVNGLMDKAKPYPLVVDTRVESSAVSMIGDLASREIDVAIMWGPIAGYYARLADPRMRVALLTKDSGGPQLAYRIAMGVRATDQNWKRLLNRLIAENRAEIEQLLTGFGVPLLDEKDQPITGATTK
ncbi:MAG TPA: substrate-binding domain-containing protein [Xanthobacteraceae bacterium]|nr:substrate-binding domain-containing protein [Xanthobacteraceae bacterium]